MASVEEILSNRNEKAVFKSIEVAKDIELDIDEGNLLAVDKNPLDLSALGQNQEKYLQSLARDDVQLLINALWKLPIERVEDAVVAELPAPKTPLPREKPIPKPKAPTRWEQYAKLKGIQNKKKSRMVWDEEAKEWRPRWGYKRAGDTSKDWAIEVPDTADPMEDQFEKKNKEKRERVAKNELQRLSNIARHSKGKSPGLGMLPTENPEKEQVGRALSLAKKSTASIGKFTDALPKEKPAKNQGKKRKFEGNLTSIVSEKKRALDIVERIQSKKATLDIMKATNQQIAREDAERRDENLDRKPKKGQGKKAKGKDRSERPSKVKDRGGEKGGKGKKGFGQKGGDKKRGGGGKFKKGGGGGGKGGKSKGKGGKSRT